MLGLRRVSFASALKADLETLGCRKGDPGFREVAIAYGTDHKRGIDPDYWVRRLEADTDGFAGVVVDDVRFPNEVAALRRAGGVAVRLMASPSVRSERLGLDFTDPFLRSDSPSEQAEALYADLLVANDSARTPADVATFIVNRIRELDP